MRWTVQRTIFHLLDESVPALADPFPLDDPMPGAYELQLPSRMARYMRSVPTGSIVIDLPPGS